MQLVHHLGHLLTRRESLTCDEGIFWVELDGWKLIRIVILLFW